MVQILHYCTFIKYLSIYSSVLPIRAHHARQTGRNNDVRRRSDYLMSLCPSLHSRGRSSLSRVFQASSPLVILSVCIWSRSRRDLSDTRPNLLHLCWSKHNLHPATISPAAFYLPGPVRSIVSPSLPRLHWTENPLTPANIWLWSLFTHSLPDKSLCSRLRCFGSTPGGRCYQNITHQDCLKEVCLDVSTSLFYAVYQLI